MTQSPQLPSEENPKNPFNLKWALAIGALILAFMLLMIGVFVFRTRVDTDQMQAGAVSPSASPTEESPVGSGEGADPDEKLPLVLPEGVAEGQDYLVLKADQLAADAPVVDVYLDYLCPFCSMFEDKAGVELDKLISDGKAEVHLHMIPMLDHYTNPVGYSARAGNAALCMNAQSPNLLLPMHRSLFAHQPPEGGAGLSDAQLAGLARELGGNASTEKCINQHTYTPWLRRVVKPTALARVQGTPTILINGQVFEGDWRVPGTLTAAVTK